jgi:hypothetical protein
VRVQQSAHLQLTAGLFIAGTMLITLGPHSGEINPQMSTAVRLSIRGPAGIPATTHTPTGFPQTQLIYTQQPTYSQPMIYGLKISKP